MNTVASPRKPIRLGESSSGGRAANVAVAPVVT